MPNAEGVLNAAGSLGYCEPPRGLRGEPCWGLWRSVRRNVRKVCFWFIYLVWVYSWLYFIGYIFIGSFFHFYIFIGYFSCRVTDKINLISTGAADFRLPEEMQSPHKILREASEKDNLSFKKIDRWINFTQVTLVFTNFILNSCKDILRQFYEKVSLPSNELIRFLYQVMLP